MKRRYEKPITFRHLIENHIVDFRHQIIIPNWKKKIKRDETKKEKLIETRPFKLQFPERFAKIIIAREKKTVDQAEFSCNRKGAVTFYDDVSRAVLSIMLASDACLLWHSTTLTQNARYKQ